MKAYFPDCQRWHQPDTRVICITVLRNHVSATGGNDNKAGQRKQSRCYETQSSQIMYVYASGSTTKAGRAPHPLD